MLSYFEVLQVRTIFSPSFSWKKRRKIKEKIFGQHICRTFFYTGWLKQPLAVRPVSFRAYAPVFVLFYG
jgi:hypothetical protein